MDMFYCGSQWGYVPPGYVINIPQDSCSIPLNLKVTFTNAVATFSWNAPHDYFGFILEYRIVGAPDWIVHPMIVGQDTVISLIGNSLYEWRLKTACAIDRFSAYVAGPNFGTARALAPCSGSLGVLTSIAAPGSNILRVSWASVLAKFYTYTITNSGGVVIKTLSGSFLFFDWNHTGYAPGSYTIKVVATCFDNTTSFQTISYIKLPSGPTEPPVGPNTGCNPPFNLTYTSTAIGAIVSWFDPVITGGGGEAV